MSASLSYTPSTELSPGVWFTADIEAGAFGAAPAPTGSETTSVSVISLAFDPTVSSPDADTVGAFTTGAAALNPVEVDPATSVTIPITINVTHLWVTNGGNSVTELNASAGSWVRTLSVGSSGFNDPDGIAFDGTHLWVTNATGASVTEIWSH